MNDRHPERIFEQRFQCDTEEWIAQIAAQADEELRCSGLLSADGIDTVRHALAEWEVGLWYPCKHQTDASGSAQRLVNLLAAHDPWYSARVQLLSRMRQLTAEMKEQFEHGAVPPADVLGELAIAVHQLETKCGVGMEYSRDAQLLLSDVEGRLDPSLASLDWIDRILIMWKRYSDRFPAEIRASD